MNNTRKCRELKITLFAVLGLISCISIHADELSWKNIGTSGDFFTADNWTNDITGATSTVPPASNDKITFGAGSYTVTQDSIFTSGPMNIGAGVTLNSQAELGWSSNTYDYVNSGTLKFTGSGLQTWRLWSQPKLNRTIYNYGLVEVDGATVDLVCRYRAFDNSGGTFSVVNGGVFIWEEAFTMNNGSIVVDNTSTITCTKNNVGLIWTDVSCTNAGQMTFVQVDTSTADGNTQYIGPYFRGSSIVENTGTISLTNNSTGVRKADTILRCYQTSTLHNLGTIDVVNNGTTNEFHKAYIMSDLTIINGGNISLSKVTTAGDTYLTVTSSGNTYMQTNGSIRLEGGAEIWLPTDQIATIDGGSIGGDGYIDEKLQVASDAAVAFTLRGASDYDVLTVEKTVELGDGSEVQISLDGFVPEDTDTFDVLVATGGFTGTDASTLVPVESTPSSRSWKIEIIGETAPQVLRLSAIRGGTLMIIK